jgi:hypothetical protein
MHAILKLKSLLRLILIHCLIHCLTFLQDLRGEKMLKDLARQELEFWEDDEFWESVDFGGNNELWGDDESSEDDEFWGYG